MNSTPIRTILMSGKTVRARWAGLLAALTLVCLLAAEPTRTARAANLIVNPLTGLDSVALDQRFYWSGTLPVFIHGIGTPGGGDAFFDPIYELTVATNATVDAMSLDGFDAGDEFELWADGAPVQWDNSFFDGSGYFHGEVDDFFLTPGTHQFTVRVINGFSLGGAWLSFSPVTIVPEPSALALTAVVSLGVASQRRRRRTRAAA